MTLTAQSVGDVEGERQVSASMPPDECAVDPHFAILVDGSEMEQHTITHESRRQRDAPPIPQRFARLQYPIDAG